MAELSEDGVEKAENPAATTEAGSFGDALARLRSSGEGVVTEAQLAHLLEMQAKALRAEFAAQAPTSTLGTDALQSAVARLHEAPKSWHQAAIQLLVEEDPELRARAPAIFRSGVVMVLGQSIALAAIMSGALFRTCATNDQCPQQGTFCSLGGYQRCSYCGSHAPLEAHVDPVTGGVLNDGEASAFIGMNHTHAVEVCAAPEIILEDLTYDIKSWIPRKREYIDSWCDACVHPISGRADSLTAFLLAAMNVAAMTLPDWLALAFAATMVSIAMCGELRDILMCSAAINAAGDRLPPRWRTGALLLIGLRRHSFLAIFPGVILVVVTSLGADALSICFNTVAVLFLVDIDNVAYSVILDETVRTHIEQTCQTKFDAADRATWSLARSWYVTLVPAFLIIGLILMFPGVPALYQIGVVLQFSVCLVCDAAIFLRGGPGVATTTVEKCHGVALAGLRWLGGVISFGALFMLTMTTADSFRKSGLSD